ncbi:PepSY-associated TM helix domain-containing protein [Poseidonibacter lekithochrous]|uniref:PepSY-associated TM helix domain-containing protein n=1 Tax=Poseidonibacter lekithochrous TaxID=1904463 RepID=UPI000D35D18F|nr:PepSY-associated TM helix domain-containing protein [Poseidonibacter lekithochrous]
MKKRLFNIHKLIGVNIILFFFLSLFFGILTIFQPYINFWEDSKQHISKVKIEDINLDKCFKQITKRTYIDENGKKMSKDLIKLNFPAKEVKANNLIRVKNRPNFYLDPHTCKKVKPKNFTISKLFDQIHTGRIFNSLVFRIIFGFMSVAVVFLTLSGLYLVIKNHYKNAKTKTAKGLYAKYHRLILLYTLPLVFMFGITGALFNLGVYSSPLITNYLTNGETSNILKVDRNILFDPDLEVRESNREVKSLSLNTLYTKAKEQFDDISFYEMQVYNYNDANAKVKFIGYEPNNYFISSVGNETYIVLDGINAKVLDKKVADQGTFAEKTLDSIFYLHYLRTFSDIPRIIFGLISLTIFIGLVFAMVLWLERSKKDSFSYKVIKPLSFTIMLGSLLSASTLFATTWLIPKKYMYFNFLDKLQNTQEILFYAVYFLLFIYILIKKDLFIITKNSFKLSALLLIVAVISHGIMSGYTLFNSYYRGLTEIFFTDLVLIFVALLFLLFSSKLNEKYFIKHS